MGVLRGHTWAKPMREADHAGTRRKRGSVRRRIPSQTLRANSQTRSHREQRTSWRADQRMIWIQLPPPLQVAVVDVLVVAGSREGTVAESSVAERVVGALASVAVLAADWECTGSHSRCSRNRSDKGRIPHPLRRHRKRRRFATHSPCKCQCRFAAAEVAEVASVVAQTGREEEKEARGATVAPRATAVGPVADQRDYNQIQQGRRGSSRASAGFRSMV